MFSVLNVELNSSLLKAWDTVFILFYLFPDLFSDFPGLHDAICSPISSARPLRASQLDLDLTYITNWWILTSERRWWYWI